MRRGALLPGAALLLLPVLASAQIPDLEPPPWIALADTGGASVIFETERLRDPATDWSALRYGLTLLWGSGEGARLFARERYLSFSAGRRRVLDRWPDLRGPDAGPAWPGESQVGGWGRPELGLLARVGLPLLGRSALALTAGLPVGRDELYPFSSASFPVRLLVRRGVPLGGGFALAGLFGGTLHLDSGRAVLEPDAFPGGWTAGAALLRNGGAGGELAVETERAGGRSQLRARLDWWLPLGAGQAVRLQWRQVVGGREDRAFETGLGIAWRVGLPAAPAKAAPGTAVPPTRPAG